MTGETQVSLRWKLYNEVYDFPGCFTLEYFRRTVRDPSERVVFEGVIGPPTDKSMFPYLELERKPGEEAKVTIKRIDLPQDITSMLDSDVFSSEVQEMLRESGLVEKAEGSGLEVECEVSTDKNDILE